MRLEAVLLDAGGVLVNPNWARVSDALARHGVAVDPLRLAAAEPLAKRELDTPERVRATSDATRGWKYFNLVLTHAGLALSDATDGALAELHEYHREHNLWESVPDEVPVALAALQAPGPAAGRGLERERYRAREAHAPGPRRLVRPGDRLAGAGGREAGPGAVRVRARAARASARRARSTSATSSTSTWSAPAPPGCTPGCSTPPALYADHDCPRFPTLAAVVEGRSRLAST